MDGQAHPNVAVHQPNKRGPLGPVCICRDFVFWHSAHGVDWVEAGHRAQHGHSNGVQNTLGDRCGDVRVWVGSMVGGLVVAGASWGYGKKCCGLNKILPMPMLILLLVTTGSPVVQMGLPSGRLGLSI